MSRQIAIMGYASDAASSDDIKGAGVFALFESVFLRNLVTLGVKIHWLDILYANENSDSTLQIVHQLSKKLSELVKQCVTTHEFFCVLGGDHTSAIGTWKGAQKAKNTEGPIGLLWIDAHLDSHTPETTKTGNLHGMPLACLLGFGDSLLTNLQEGAALKAENICVIGARSFEQEEYELLKKLKVRIFFMDEIKKRGMNAVMQEALDIVTKNTVGYGLSIDIDSIDPQDAPGTSVSEEDGIIGAELCEALRLLADDSRLLGMEVVEFNFLRDVNQITEKLIANIVSAVTLQS